MSGAGIETARLLLRPFRSEDAEDLYRYASDPRVGPAAGWRPHRSVEESREVIETVYRQPGVFALMDKATGRVIGSAGFTGFHRRETRAKDDQIGYSLSPSHWGRGLAGEAVEALLRLAFGQMGLELVWCEHYDGNINSKRVIQRCGFRYRFLRLQKAPELDRQPRLVLVYALTKEEWSR